MMYENKLANGEIRTEMETLTVADTSPYLNKKNSPVRVPVALNVYQGKAYLKAYKLTQGGEWQAQADRLQRASKAPFFGAHNLIHGLKAGIPCWAWVSRGSRF